MNQLWCLIRFDLLMQIRERGNVLLLALAMMVAWFGLWQGAQFHATTSAFSLEASAQETAARNSAAVHAKQFFANPDIEANQAERSFRNRADLRGYAFREHLGFAIKPAVPGASLAIAQADVLPSYARVRAESMDSVRNSNEIEHPMRLAAGRFDLMFVVLYLWPLILLALTTSVLTQDRELKRLNTLRLQGVHPFALLAAQIGARVFVATFIFVVLTGVAAFVIGAVPMTSVGWFAFMRWSAAVGAYSLFWAAVAAAICALCASRNTASFAAFGAWVMLTILLPSTLAAGINLAAPMPSREDYLIQTRNAADKLNADRINMTARFYDQHPEWRLANTPIAKISPAVMRLARAAEMERELGNADAKFNAAKQAQTALLLQWLAFSPVSVAHHVFSQLSGNDSARHDQFLAETHTHQIALRDFFQLRIQLAAIAEDAAPCKHPSTTCLPGFGFVDHAGVPSFIPSAALFAAPSMSAMWWVLLLWAAIFIALASFFLARFSSSRHAPDKSLVAA